MPDPIGKGGHRSIIRQLVILTIAMFGFGYLLVPLYDVFCDITGFGGRTNTVPVAAMEAPDLEREIRVEFVTTTNEYAQFVFGADVDSMTVHPGKMYYATFTAKNLSARDVVTQAVPSVTPVSAAEHFVKIECFCFTEQVLKSGEEKDMPVTFFIDPKIIDDPDAKDIGEITLSYTFFRTDDETSNVDKIREKTRTQNTGS